MSNVIEIRSSRSPSSYDAYEATGHGHAAQIFFDIKQVGSDGAIRIAAEALAHDMSDPQSMEEREAELRAFITTLFDVLVQGDSQA
ncbi:hypothetical protein [Stenotrophomonas sp. GD03958]|uniref:hypothetical protein n=1 Tax=Stenotrophomonas sp. GD03958 TaxID=2975411 RepID=UPI0024468B93|nr:hypothetical protein [Stenotrophomonas sp. GD03958]MDH1192537.1 hypothetical protein [Stenotrophomonas sp. GD03958]